MDKKQIVELVKDGLRAIPDYPLCIDDVTEDTVLTSKEGWSLDSMGMATLVIELEALIDERYHKQIDIIGGKMFDVNNSPFRTVGTMAEHIIGEME